MGSPSISTGTMLGELVRKTNIFRDRGFAMARYRIRKGGLEGNLYLAVLRSIGGYTWTKYWHLATRFNSQESADKFASKVGLVDYGVFTHKRG